MRKDNDDMILSILRIILVILVVVSCGCSIGAVVKKAKDREKIELEIIKLKKELEILKK